MTPQTFFSIMNSSSDDFIPKYNPTLADAIGHAEFEEDVSNWEDVAEE